MKLHHWIIIIFIQLLLVVAGLFAYHHYLGGSGIDPSNAITIWAAVITIVFIVFAVLGIMNIDGKIKEVENIKEKQTKTFQEIEESSKAIIDQAKEAKQQIVNQAEKEINNILKRSTNRQNYFDQVTGINNEMAPDKRVLAFTSFLRENKEVEGIDFAYIYLGRGHAYMQLNKPREAKNDFEMALEVCQPFNKEKAYAALGGYYVAVQDFPHSIEYFKKALELNPQSAMLCMDIGNSYNAIGDYDEAEKYYKRALTFNPELAEIYYNKAVKASDQAKGVDKEQTEAYLDKCIEINPMFIKAHINKAGLLVRDKKYDEAINELSFVTDKVFDPDIIHAIEARGAAYRLSGNLSKALCDFMWVQVFQHDNIQNMANLAATYLELGYLNEAGYYAQQGLKQGDATNDHKYDEALQLILKAIDAANSLTVPLEFGENEDGK